MPINFKLLPSRLKCFNRFHLYLGALCTLAKRITKCPKRPKLKLFSVFSESMLMFWPRLVWRQRRRTLVLILIVHPQCGPALCPYCAVHVYTNTNTTDTNTKIQLTLKQQIQIQMILIVDPQSGHALCRHSVALFNVTSAMTHFQQLTI